MRGITTLTAFAAAPLVPALLATAAAPAYADEVVLPGPSFPDARTRVTYVSCGAFLEPDARPPLLRLNRGPAQLPAGERSLGVLPASSGTATGPLHLVPSVASASLSLWVHGRDARPPGEEGSGRTAGARGVAYAWLGGADAPAGHAWRGFADLQAPVGWTRVEVGELTLTWTLVDLGADQVAGGGGSATLAEFVDQHGDGPGLLMAGFGCDGEDFSLDAITVSAGGGPRTYDLEGLPLTTTISSEETEAGATELRGVTSGPDDEPVGEALVLESAPAGSTEFEAVDDPIAADDDGVVSVEVDPEVDTAYRWRMPEVEYAEGHVSDSVTVPGR